MNGQEFENKLYDADKLDFQRYDRAMQQNERGLDHLTLVVGTGVFVISVSFITGFSNVEFEYPILLVCSWIVFASLIFSHALGYFLGIYTARITQSKMCENPNLYKAIRPTEITEVKVLIRCIDGLRVLNLVLLAIGISTLVLFASVNIL